MEEDSQGLEELEDRDPSVHLSWALRAPSSSKPVDRDARAEERDSEWKMDEMRREIGNLQLDMLRMGRNLKVSFQVVDWSRSCRLMVIS